PTAPTACSADMSATTPSWTSERPNVEWLCHCGAKLRLRSDTHLIVAATSLSDPGISTASGVLWTMWPKSSAAASLTAWSKLSCPSSGGGGMSRTGGAAKAPFVATDAAPAAVVASPAISTARRLGFIGSPSPADMGAPRRVARKPQYGHDQRFGSA